MSQTQIIQVDSETKFTEKVHFIQLLSEWLSGEYSLVLNDSKKCCYVNDYLWIWSIKICVDLIEDLFFFHRRLRTNVYIWLDTTKSFIFTIGLVNVLRCANETQWNSVLSVSRLHKSFATNAKRSLTRWLKGMTGYNNFNEFAWVREIRPEQCTYKIENDPRLRKKKRNEFINKASLVVEEVAFDRNVYNVNVRLMS